MRAICAWIPVTNFGELLVAVVRLVGEAEPALHHEDDVAARVTGVIINTHAIEATQALSLELSNERDELFDRADSKCALNIRRNWMSTERVRAILVDKTRI